MLVYKILFHIIAFWKLIFLKLIYGNHLIIGNHVTWRRHFNVVIDKNAKIVIGSKCFFNNDCSMNALNYIEIGDGTIFGENVKIYDHNHKFSDESLDIKDQGYSIGTVKIGKHCWIGSNVVILKGAEIGDDCVIGAGTVISSTKIQSGTIVKNGSSYIFETLRRT